MQSSELKSFLDEKYRQYAQPAFLESDPIQSPHRFTHQQDIEIASLFAALFAWGQRTTIINKCTDLLSRMDNAPYDFVMEASNREKKHLETFVHRTFNSEDIHQILNGLKVAYAKYNSLEALLISPDDTLDLKSGITRFRRHFAENGAPARTLRHIPDPESGSAAKRVNMYLRWMVRKDAVDFGIWTQLSPAQLSCPLDVHSGRVARALGLLKRPQNDWRAVEELNGALREMDPSDPVKYDFALFGLGVFEGFG